VRRYALSDCSFIWYNPRICDAVMRTLVTSFNSQKLSLARYRFYIKGKVNVYLYSALSWHTSKALRYGTRSHGICFTCTPRVHPLTQWTIPAFDRMDAAEAQRAMKNSDRWGLESLIEQQDCKSKLATLCTVCATMCVCVVWNSLSESVRSAGRLLLVLSAIWKPICSIFPSF